MTRSMNKVKQTVFIVIMTLIGLGLIEVALRCIDYQLYSGQLSAIVSYSWKAAEVLTTEKRSITYDKPLLCHDPVLGFSTKPGEYRITMTVKNWLRSKHHTFKALIGPDGHRTTSLSPPEYQGKPEVWIFGCSFTWGWPLENSESFPWLVQNALPTFYVRNFAENCYGTVHALIQLQQQFASDHYPDTVVIVYNPFHLVRNVAAPSRLAKYQIMDSLKSCRHAKATLDSLGKLHISLVSVFPTIGEDPPHDYMIRITKEILSHILQLCRPRTQRVILAYQTEKDEIVEFAGQCGFEVCDISLQLTEDLICAPFDAHPNAKAHQIYAMKLLDCLTNKR